MNGTVEARPTPPPGAAATAPVLRIRGLVKRFGDLTAVAGLDLDVRPGEVFGLLGPNGAGKTTTIRVVCGELAADEGEILLNGAPLGTRARDRSRVGLCPQEIVLWHQLTCAEQLEFAGRLYHLPRRTARERARRLLADLGLEQQAGSLAGRLSGGMQRRLNIALALVHAPELVILDEPGAGLDPQSRVLVRDFIRTLAREATVLLTTHEMDEAERLCDRVAIVDHGRLLVCDSPDGLRHSLGAAEVIELRIPSAPGSAVTPSEARLTTALAEAAAVGPEAVVIHRGAVTVRCERAAAVLPAVLDRLDADAIAPDEVRLRQVCLEDVFIGLTGSALRS